MHACTSECRQVLCFIVHIHILQLEYDWCIHETVCARERWQSLLGFNHTFTFCSLVLDTACSFVVPTHVTTSQFCSMQGKHHLVHGKLSMTVHDASVWIRHTIYILYFVITDHAIQDLSGITLCCHWLFWYKHACCHRPWVTRCIIAIGSRSHSSSWQLHPQGRRRRRRIPSSVPARLCGGYSNHECYTWTRQLAGTACVRRVWGSLCMGCAHYSRDSGQVLQCLWGY